MTRPSPLLAALLGALLAAPLLAAAPDGGPDAERARAQAAVNAARKALDASEANPEARAQLELAEQHLAQGRFAQSASAADEAWRRLAGEKKAGTAFSVEVFEEGRTEVTTRSGGVRVSAGGVQRDVPEGHQVTVKQGQAPSEPLRPPDPPALVAPLDRARFRLKPQQNGKLGPVRLAWKAVPGAVRYEVYVIGEPKAEPLQLTSARAELTLPPLRPGRYQWRVRALGREDLASKPSGERNFELEVDPLKLEVKGTGWK